jgi:hypothetical protein
MTELQSEEYKKNCVGVAQKDAGEGGQGCFRHENFLLTLRSVLFTLYLYQLPSENHL